MGHPTHAEHMILVADTMTHCGDVAGLGSAGYRDFCRNMNISAPFTEAAFQVLLESSPLLLWVFRFLRMLSCVPKAKEREDCSTKYHLSKERIATEHPDNGRILIPHPKRRRALFLCPKTYNRTLLGVLIHAQTPLIVPVSAERGTEAQDMNPSVLCEEEATGLTLRVYCCECRTRRRTSSMLQLEERRKPSMEH